MELFLWRSQIYTQVLEDKGLSLKIYNLLGENVDSYSKIKLKKGVNQFNWKPNQQVSGIYFFQIELNNAIYKQKVLFIK